MTAPTLILPLAEAVLEQVVEHADSHDQTTYGVRRKCGSFHCIAGWTAVLAGAELSWTKVEAYDDFQILEGVRLPGRQAWSDPHHAAAELLGLDEDTASELFAAGDEDHAVALLTSLIADARSASTPQNASTSVPPAGVEVNASHLPAREAGLGAPPVAEPGRPTPCGCGEWHPRPLDDVTAEDLRAEKLDELLHEDVVS